jgi:hypothetical protein
MNSFIRVAALILVLAGGYSAWEVYKGAPLTGERVKTAEVDAGRKARLPRPQPVSKSPPHRIRTDRTIDVAAARPPRPDHLERMIAARGGSDFPILIPAAMTANAEIAGSYKVRLKLLDDGYSVVITMADMDVVIYGTRTVFRRESALNRELEDVKKELSAKRATTNTTTNTTTGAQTGANDPATGTRTIRVMPRLRADYGQSFEETDDGRGGSISIGRFGVDYHIEFYCHSVEAIGGENCIDEARALAFVAMMEEGSNAKR